jgi:hypothetical protein
MMDGTTTPSALRTPAEGVWRHATGNSYAFRMKSFTFDAQNVFTGLVDHFGGTNHGSRGRCLRGARNRRGL